MRLTDEARHYCNCQQQQQPRIEDKQRCTERDERYDILSRREQLRKQCDTPDGLPTRSFQLIVEDRIFEVKQIERRRVLHQTDARMIAEEIAEQTLDER